MSNCGCKWDGNLDGHLRRCRQHQAVYKTEKRAAKVAEQARRREIAMSELACLGQEDGS